MSNISTLGGLYKQARSALPNLKLAEVKIILANILRIDSTQLNSTTEVLLDSSQQIAYKSILDKLALDHPLPYLLGVTQFHGLDIVVDKGVLIPRPETEQLVDLAINASQRLFIRDQHAVSILEVGVGTGCIAVSVAKHLADTATLSSYLGIDISSKAIANTQKNILGSNLGQKVSTLKYSLQEFIKSYSHKQFDLVISNPPYLTQEQMQNLPKSVRNFEPRAALFGGRDGLRYYRQLLSLARLQKERYKVLPALVLEADPAIISELEKLVVQVYPAAEIQVHKDQFGPERFITAQKL